MAAAVAMQGKMGELARRWLESGLDHALKLRVGISQDYATVGNFGSKDLMEYTAIGSAVMLMFVIYSPHKQEQAIPGTTVMQPTIVQCYEKSCMRITQEPTN